MIPQSEGDFWQGRFYDFNVVSGRKKIEKIKYVRHNPVRRGLVKRPEQWEGSSFRVYLTGKQRVLQVSTT